jgi:hypothetical protein
MDADGVTANQAVGACLLVSECRSHVCCWVFGLSELEPHEMSSRAGCLRVAYLPGAETGAVDLLYAECLNLRVAAMQARNLVEPVLTC